MEDAETGAVGGEASSNEPSSASSPTILDNSTLETSIRHRLHSMTSVEPLVDSLLDVGSVWNTRLQAQQAAGRFNERGGFQR